MRLRSLLLATVVSVVPSHAAGQVPAGGEFRVNTSTLLSQETGQRSVAVASEGSFVVVWDSGQTITDWDVFGQRFDASGAPRGAEFRLNMPPHDIHAQTGAVVTTLDAAGAFVVVWHSAYQDNFGYAVVGRRYGADGAPAGPEFLVNTTTPNNQRAPDVAADANGNFVVVWRGDGQGIVAQRFDRTGAPVGGEFVVHSFTAGPAEMPRVDVDGSGGFVVVWVSRRFLPYFNYGIFGRRFDASGAPRGAEFRANDVVNGGQVWPAVATDAEGRFVVAWESNSGLFAKRYDGAGIPLGNEFRVSVATTSEQTRPSVDLDDVGNVVVAWGGVDEAWLRRFSADGAALTGDFRVNTYTTSTQWLPTAAVDRVGNVVVAWRSYFQDGDANGVFAQRFGGLSPSALRVDTTGNGVLEPGESAVPVRPSWTNRNGAAQSFTGQIADPLGPPGGVPGISLAQAIYGTVPNGDSGECTSCYTVFLPAPVPRPVTHWDASVDERILPMTLGQHKRWTLHVGDSFTDVPRASPFYRFVETLLHRGVTSGCAATTYCPAASTTREQMAVFILVAKEGAGYVPPACTTPVFADVPASSPFCPWIEELARRGVVSGCGGGNYCPTANVTREQMSIFVLRVLDPTLDPPACTTPVFADVPASSPFCRWIEELANRSVVSGCGGGNYCPTASVTREQMGVFISVTFGLSLYGT